MKIKKKKIVFINSVIGNGSTGRICVDLANQYIKKGYDAKIAYGRGKCDSKLKKYAIRIGNFIDVLWHVFMTRIFDKHGLCSIFATKRFLIWLDKYNPDEIWLHNIHGYYINYELLFKWLKEHPKIIKKWTLHDCWAFTGHCAHYTYNRCYMWKNNCSKCKYHSVYPSSVLFSNSKINYIKKRNSFCGVKKMKIITPSQWLKNELKNSFLKKYGVVVIHNTINKKIFKYTSSDLKEKLNIKDKKIILSVANVWNKQKGYDDLLALDKLVTKDYVIIIIGLNCKQIKDIQNISLTHIIPIGKLNNQKELAKYYSIADIFFNPTYEDTYPTVNLEAEACNTPVISYNVCGANETIKLKESRLINF